MKVRFNKWIGIGFLVMGVGLVCLACLAGNAAFTFVIGCGEIWYGILFLKNPYFFFDDTKLEVYALAGNKVASYEFQSLKDIEIDNTKLLHKVVLKQHQESQTIKVSPWMVDRSDWQVFMTRISTTSRSI